MSAPGGNAAADAATTAQFRIRPADESWRTGLPRAADAATQAYLDRLPADVVARSNAYFEGGYWLQLWNFLLGLADRRVLLAGRRSARMRDWAERVGRKPFLRDAIFGALYAAVAWLLSLPLTIYQATFASTSTRWRRRPSVLVREQLVGLAVEHGRARARRHRALRVLRRGRRELVAVGHLRRRRVPRAARCWSRRWRSTRSSTPTSRSPTAESRAPC
jgi:hypothetical protein